MKTFRKDIWENGEYNYPAAYGFLPNIRAYLHEDEDIHDCMLVVPGGGYCMVVPSEAFIIAKEFYDRGMNAFVLTYTTDITMSVPLKSQPLEDISRAVRVIRKNSTEYGIDENRLFICGFSAGSHVCGSLCVHYDDVKEKNDTYVSYSNRPDAAILSYPVITAGEYTHIYSIQALLGKNPTKEELDYYSVEKNVTPDTPPCFIWQTQNDDAVPVENSYFMAQALRKNGVYFAHHVFQHGFHGLSFGSEDFFKGNFGEEYTYEQLHLAIENVKNNTAVNVSKERHDELMEQFFGENSQMSPEHPEADPVEEFKDVTMWLELAYHFLKTLK